MNAMDRVRVALSRQGDACPVIPQLFGFCAAMTGVPLRDYLTCGATLAQCQLKTRELFDYDAVFGVMDVSVETEALGSQLVYHPERYPSVARYALADPDQLERLSLPDPGSSGRMPELLRALALMREELGDRVPVLGLVLGPMTLAGQLLGLERALYLAIDAPERFQELLGFAARVAELYGRAQLEAGAHLVIVFDPAASPEVVPPGLFREFELPLVRSLFASFKAAGSLANWLHIVGPVQPLLPHYTAAGAEVANFDYPVGPKDAALVPGLCVSGNLNPASFVVERPGQILGRARELVCAMQGRGGFVLSSGCEIPPEARPDNVRALVAAAREWEAVHA